MRLLYGFIAFLAWTGLYSYMIDQGCVISDDTALIAIAIVTAGAMAGGG